MFSFSLARIFSRHRFSGFRTTRSSNYSVYDGECTHTHLSRAHFFCAEPTHCVLRTSSCVSHTRMAQVSVKRCLHMCHTSPSRLLSSDDSPIFLAVPARSLRDQSRLRLHWLWQPHDLAVLSRPESAGRAPLRTCIAKFGWLARSDANTGYEPKEFDKITSVDTDTILINEPNHTFSGFSRTTNENTRHVGVLTVFESSVTQRSHDDFALQVESKENMQPGNRFQTERNRWKRRFCDQCGWIDVKEKSTEQNLELFSSGSHEIWLWRVTENPVLKSLRKFYSDGWDLREHLQRRAQQAIINDSMDRSSSAGEYICVANWWWRIIFVKNATQEVAEKLKNWDFAAVRKRNTEKQRRLEESLTQHDQESRTVSLIFYDPDLLSSYDIPTFLIKLLLLRVQESRAATLECREIHERIWVFLETLLTVNMLDEILKNYELFKNFGNTIGNRWWFQGFWEQKELKKVGAKNHWTQYFYLALQ